MRVSSFKNSGTLIHDLKCVEPRSKLSSYSINTWPIPATVPWPAASEPGEGCYAPTTGPAGSS